MNDKERDMEDKSKLDYINLLSTFNLGTIALIKSIFNSNELDYFLHGENFNNVDPLIQPVKFFVRKEQVEVCMNLLKDLDLKYLGISIDSKETG
jgi:hypothetical protein